ncbi:hypothetical protein JTE90_014936 [Oedothorax gibbosus]|uniref:Uncharacterized protein n=1 Tax=Oedothorax gibbosus TaxID=931172 RepID=A0AAV6VLU5_9ARAC|nr:hypothetical protein JTE90_014936 [Oedothorax gibbosus]
MCFVEGAPATEALRGQSCLFRNYNNSFTRQQDQHTPHQPRPYDCLVRALTIPSTDTPPHDCRRRPSHRSPTRPIHVYSAIRTTASQDSKINNTPRHPRPYDCLARAPRRCLRRIDRHINQHSLRRPNYLIKKMG